MKMKGGLIGLVVIVLALTFIGPGDVGATNCYYLFYTPICSQTDGDIWEAIAIAIHRDKTWEGYQSGNVVSGIWDVYGKAINIHTTIYTPGTPDFFSSYPLLAGVYSGKVKLDFDPFKSKANISKAQGFFEHEHNVGCWYLRKTSVDVCGWIEE